MKDRSVALSSTTAWTKKVPLTLSSLTVSEVHVSAAAAAAAIAQILQAGGGRQCRAIILEDVSMHDLRN